MVEIPELEVERVATDELVEYKNNAKLHPNEQVDQIVESILEFGFNSPILCWHNEEGEPEIVSGHGRLLAARKLDMKELPVIFLDHLTPKQRQAYIIVDNKLTMNSDFDYDMLAAELEELSDDFDMQDFGFAPIELDDIDNEDLLDDDVADTPNIGKVIYEPKNTDHHVDELYYLDRPDLDELIAGIENDELRKMFEIRKQWFAEFNFAKVADYYAFQATPQEQRVFEALGMVLLDRDQLIENGFAKIVGEALED